MATNNVTADQMDELHADAIAIERSRRERLALSRAEIQVGDILDFELVTAISNTDPDTGLATPGCVRVRYGQQWDSLRADSETVSVHRSRTRHTTCPGCRTVQPLQADGSITRHYHPEIRGVECIGG